MVAKQNTTDTREKEYFERVLFFHFPSSRGRKTRVAGCSGFYECSSLDITCTKKGIAQCRDGSLSPVAGSVNIRTQPIESSGVCAKQIRKCKTNDELFGAVNRYPISA